ncbi:MAG: LpxI family protein, partial [Pseudomonadota bacterium]|nr:LpxI family protein [Pseudomonadota bacterium]
AEGGRVVAVEGAEGTDEMLARIVRMREIGRMPQEGKNGVLVKTMKPGQDMRADLPAIGPDTVTAVARAGLRGIVLEADHSIILQRAQTLTAARTAGLYVHGVDAREVGNDE